jgi:peptidoglycan/LPS O-acetylase OafA/YrhL
MAQAGTGGPPLSRLAYIDALRGIAIIGVIATHTAFLFQGIPWRVGRLIGLGGGGVQLFFVASALTLLLSWHSRHETAAQAYVRRLFRIAPMFWLALAVYTSLDAILVHPFWIEGTVNARTILLTIIFCHGWSPDSINAVVPGGWTIAVEMTFYVMLPVLATCITSLRRACLLVTASILLAAVANTLYPTLAHAEPTHQVAEFTSYWLPEALPSFALGFIAFHLSDRLPVSRLLAGALLFGAMLTGLYLAWGPLPYSATLLQPISRGPVSAAAGVMLALSLDLIPTGWLVNRVICYVGRVSYSVYLTHWLVLEALLLTVGQVHASPAVAFVLWLCTVPVVIAASVGVSTLTYRWVETPGIRTGSRIARGMRLRSAPQPTVV